MFNQKIIETKNKEGKWVGMIIEREGEEIEKQLGKTLSMITTKEII